MIPISWRGANVHAIYCMTASHISINPYTRRETERGGCRTDGERVCVGVCKSGERKQGRKQGSRANKEVGER